MDSSVMHILSQCVIELYNYHAMAVHAITHAHNIHSFIQTISIALLQVHYSEALPTQHGYCAGVSRRSVTGNCRAHIGIYV